MVAFTPVFLAALAAFVSAAPMQAEPAMSSAMAASVTSSAMSSHMTAESKPMESMHESKPMESMPMHEQPQHMSPPPTYGSGSSQWKEGGGYDSCVQQCIKDFSSPPAEWKPSPTATQGSKGTGATHTVIVAPSQGVLRYVPFHVNASIGDTIQFMWGANGHTVTKGSALLPCNKSADAPSFTSGLNNKDFSFTQLVNTTEPTYFFCNAPGHCQKGMFGIINPKTSSGSDNSYEKQVMKMAETMPNIAAEYTYTTEKCKSSPKAASWGAGLDMSALPEWARPMAAENTMYTKTFLAANADVWTADGKIDMSMNGSKNPLMIPSDVSVALNNAAAAPAVAAPATPANAAAGAPSSSAQASPSAAPAKSGASALAPTAFVGALALAFTFFAL